MVLGFVAENDLPFTVTSGLLELTRAGAKDKEALGEVKLNWQAALYKMVNGVSKTFTNTLAERLKQNMFSMNVDKSTTKSQKKVLAVLVSYFDGESNEVVNEHLDSFEVVRADAQSIYNGLEKIIQSNEVVNEHLDSFEVVRADAQSIYNGLEK